MKKLLIALCFAPLILAAGRAAGAEEGYRLDRSPVKSIRYRGSLYKGWLAAFVVVFVVLGYLGTEPTTVWGQFGFEAFFLDTKDIATWVARLCSIVYFLFFFLMPWYTARDKVKPLPERVTYHH